MSYSSIGERLRTAREAIPASLYQASRETKIRVDFLELMERDNFRFMSGGTYVKGLLKGYGRWLGLDEDVLCEELDRIHNIRTEPTSVSKIFKEPAQGPKSKRPGAWLIAAVTAAAILVGLSLVGLVSPGGPKVASPSNPQEKIGSPLGSSPSPAPQIAEAPPVVPKVQGVQLAITVTGDKCWIRAVADGNDANPLISKTLFKGQTANLLAKDILRVTFGNLGAVHLVANGRDLGPVGTAGQSGTFVFDPGTTTLTRG